MALPLQDPSLLQTQSYINGDWTDADNGETLDVDNPASGAVIASVARCGQAETAGPLPRPKARSMTGASARSRSGQPVCENGLTR